MANIASVICDVGAPQTIKDIQITDINAYYGIYGHDIIVFVIASTSVANLPSPFSSPTRFFLQVRNISNFYIQETIYDTEGRIYVRYGNGIQSGGISWTGWRAL